MINDGLVTCLTKKELEVLENVVLMGNTKSAAKIMNISPRTVETHIINIKTKLNLKFKSQLNKSYIEFFYQRKSSLVSS